MRTEFHACNYACRWYINTYIWRVISLILKPIHNQIHEINGNKHSTNDTICVYSNENSIILSVHSSMKSVSLQSKKKDIAFKCISVLAEMFTKI